MAILNLNTWLYTSTTKNLYLFSH